MSDVQRVENGPDRHSVNSMEVASHAARHAEVRIESLRADEKA
jgi:hypothetical protein